MAVFGPYTQPVKPAEWVDPLDLNMYAKGMAYKQELAEENLKKFTDQFSSAFNLPAFGVDAQQLSKLEQDFKGKLDSLNLSDLSDMSTISQMRGLINQYTSGATKEGKDLMAIAKRGSFYQNELKKKQEADEKGLPYYSRSLKQLEQYYNNPDFFTDPKDLSLSSGFVGVNLAKERNEVLKNVPKEKYLKNGRYYERYNQDALAQALNALYSDQRVQGQLQYDIEEKWKDKDWETEGINEIASYKNEAQQLYNEAVKAGRQDVAQDALNDIATYDKMMQDPKGYAEQIKNRVYSKEMQDRIDLDIEQSNFNSVDKADEYAMKAQDLANQKAMELYKTQMDLFPYLSAEDQAKVSSGGSLSGVDWGTAGQKFIEQKQKQTLESKLDDWQSKKDYESEYKKWEDDSNALDVYYSNRSGSAPKETTPGYETSLAKGESLIKEKLPEIVNYLKSKYPSYKNFLEGKVVDDIVWGDGDVYLDVSGSPRNQDIKPEHLKEAIDNLKSKSKPQFRGATQSTATPAPQSKAATFDKSKLDARTLKALEDNIKANPGASEEDVAKAMGLM